MDKDDFREDGLIGSERTYTILILSRAEKQRKEIRKEIIVKNKEFCKPMLDTPPTR